MGLSIQIGRSPQAILLGAALLFLGSALVLVGLIAPLPSIAVAFTWRPKARQRRWLATPKALRHPAQGSSSSAYPRGQREPRREP